MTADSHDTYHVAVSFHIEGGNYEDFEQKALTSGGLVDQMIMKIAQDKYGWGERMKKAVEQV
jgi:hypothetical protein